MAKARQSLAQSIGDSVVKKFIADPYSVDAVSSSQSIAISKIKLPTQQPRRFFDPTRMEQLVQSVQEHGILEPYWILSV